MLKRIIRYPLYTAIFLAQLLLLAYFCLRAYRIRLYAVKTYGYVIHEFDPWFNFRAAEYLAANGHERFFKWYDYMSWYPIGRPIGTTIFPGMQFVSVWTWELMKYLPDTKVKYPTQLVSNLPAWAFQYLPNGGKKLHFSPMSLNDVCVMGPAWFGSLGTFFVFLLSRELSESTSAGLVSAFIMAIIPAHIMRGYAGEYENEAFAVSGFCLVLYFWVRSLRSQRSWWIGLFAGLAYGYSAAAWGGYIFINNLVAIHAAFLVVAGKYHSGVYKAYSLYYVVGTFLATLVPVISYAPFKSLEQMPSLLVFLVYQVLELCDFYRRKKKGGMGAWQFFGFRVLVFTVIGVAASCAAYVGFQMGYFTPLGARIRGLFLEAMKTGNPLVDSVAEHSGSSPQAFAQYLHHARYLAVVGLLFCWHQNSPGKYLSFIYATVSYHYSLKMSRLMIINGPIVSVLAGFPIGIVADWCIAQAIGLVTGLPDADKCEEVPVRSGGMGSIIRTFWRFSGRAVWPLEIRDALELKESFRINAWFLDRPIRAAMAAGIVYQGYYQSQQPIADFIRHCEMVAESMSHPHILFQSQGRIIDDYYKGYQWLKANTAEDARVMAWWDYGYQITGVANRTTIADGNTWNHEHIATLGRILTSPVKKSHKAMRHLADYALVWAGGHSDDMGKSPHLARIGNSVFPDHCGDDDPMCRKFGFYQGGKPTPMMAESFLYQAVKHNLEDGVRLNGRLFKEVHTTKHGLMRIFEVLNVSQESKDWVANPENKKCDAPGSWYCVGQYPPALMPLIAKRRNFAQLEDFNMDGTKRVKSAYSKMIENERQR